MPTTASSCLGTVAPGSDGAATGARGDLTVKAAGDFVQAVLRAYWERDEDIGDPAVLRAIADSVRLEGERLMVLAGQVSAREELRAITARAIERGVFGVPSFFVGGEMFWGKDRLDFVERWLERLAGGQPGRRGPECGSSSGR